jgi:hypothetical protein
MRGLTAETRTSPREIFGDQVGVGQTFLQELWYSRDCVILPVLHTYYDFTRRRNGRNP